MWLADRGAALSASAERLRAQLLSGPRRPATRSPSTARLLAVQAQDPRGARLADPGAECRTRTVDQFDRALGDERSLLITWLNRGTLHLVRSEDYTLAPRADHPAAASTGNAGGWPRRE